MATVTIPEANTYFQQQVLYSQPWDVLDDDTKMKALNNSERVLYRYYRSLYSLDDSSKYMPKEAVFQQSLWLLRQDESVQKQDFGVTGLGVSGINIQMQGNRISEIAPEAQAIIEQDQEENGNGNNNGKFGWLVM